MAHACLVLPGAKGPSAIHMSRCRLCVTGENATR
ncbi:hypothetical protein EYZ11_011179 [Aspergillus tanneri]|uniref:Uncharacterized protein n=1 Tax=Aspergillus tanneri TaxID=1220188 RepID=A0A4S3J5M6_9EURO|nr:hypothetical protein EYZ11_011179 [Aspergillus tanneri]